MARRGTLYRCHLFSYAGPQTEGVVSTWAQNGVPIEGETLTGEEVELLVQIDSRQRQVRPDSRVRFDILEQDHFLTGGLDDRIVSFVGTGANPPEEGFEQADRQMHTASFMPGEALQVSLAHFKQSHPDNYRDRILILKPGQVGDQDDVPSVPEEPDVAASNNAYIVTWWTARRLEDFLNSEFYFVINVDGEFEDQSENILDVSSTRLDAMARTDVPWHPQAAARRIYALLSTNLFDWSVSNDEVREVARILQLLRPLALLRIVQLMRFNGTWDRFRRRMEQIDIIGWIDLYQATHANSGYIVPGDQLVILVFAGTSVVPENVRAFDQDEYETFLNQHRAARAIIERHAQRGRDIGRGQDTIYVDVLDLTDEERQALPPDALSELEDRMMPEYVVDERGVRLLPLSAPVQVNELRPVEAANTIARAFFEGQLLRRPSVVIHFRGRGITYPPDELVIGPRQGNYRSTYLPPADPAENTRQAHRAAFLNYIQPLQDNSPRTLTALTHYYDWISEHYGQPDFGTRTPPELWEWALEQTRPPEPTPLEAFLALAQSVQARLESEPPAERRRTQQILNRYLDWLDTNRENPNLATIDPVDIWGQMAGQVVEQEIAEIRRRTREEVLRRQVEINWELVGQKLDEALIYMQRNVWRAQPPRVEEVIEESGGIGPFFVERRGYRYLIQASYFEHYVRNLIATQYLDELMERMRTQGAEGIGDIDGDFRRWMDNRPVMLQALLVAHANPDVEVREFEVDQPLWQTVVEIGIGFIPIVGQVVAIAEIATGRSLFGRRLSTVERGITAAAILLPAAAKVARTGTRLVRASRIARDYNLNPREAEALRRAILPIRPGSGGNRTLQRAFDDVQAGRRIVDRDEIHELRRLMDQMGMTDRRTARALGLPEGPALRGAAISSETRTAHLIREAFGEETAIYRNLGQTERAAVRAAAEADPGLLRRAIRAETESGFNAYRTDLADILRVRGMPESQVAHLESALNRLNNQWRRTLVPAAESVTRQRIVGLSDMAGVRSQGDHMLQGIQDRIALYSRRSNDASLSQAARNRAQANVRRLQRQQRRIGEWLGDTARRQSDLMELRRVVSQSEYLRSIVAGGGDATLQRLWIQYFTRRGTRTIEGFEEYVRVLQRHYRGNFGEFEVAFRLGRDNIILKPPDELVTLPGTDLITISRTGGPIRLIDNKALNRAQLDSVSALTRNLPRNLAQDLDELARLARDPNLPTHFRLAVQRLTRAQQAIRQRFPNLTRRQLEDPAVQREIGRILNDNGIERVVTNAGGNVTGLSSDLRGIGIDLQNLN